MSTTKEINEALVSSAVALTGQVKKFKETMEAYEAKLVPMLRKMKKAELAEYLRRVR